MFNADNKDAGKLKSLGGMEAHKADALTPLVISVGSSPKLKKGEKPGNITVIINCHAIKGDIVGSKTIYQEIFKVLNRLQSLFIIKTYDGILSYFIETHQANRKYFVLNPIDFFVS